MLLECLIKREGPTEVNYFGFKYLFDDDGTGAKVCDVNSEEHRKQLISTGYYRIYDPTVRKQVEKDEKKANDKQKESKPDEVTPEVAVGMWTRKFMPCGKDVFKKWVKNHAQEVKDAAPARVVELIRDKWRRLFNEECPHLQ